MMPAPGCGVSAPQRRGVEERVCVGRIGTGRGLARKSQTRAAVLATAARWATRSVAPVAALLLLPARVALAGPADCLGTRAVARDVWQLAREVDSMVQVAHIPREVTSVLFDAFVAIVTSGQLTEVLADCAPGLAVLIAHSLPEAERRFGLGFAREHYLGYKQILRELPPGLAHTNSAGGTSAVWSGLETHQSAGYPLLLGLRTLSCGVPGLRIFVHETEFAVRPLACSQGMFASEVFVHRFLLHSDCRTQDPDEADFFFVPIYAACVMTKENKKAAEMDSFYKALVTHSLPHFERRGGRDYIFLWSSETYDFPSWAEHIHTSVFLSVEARPIECTDFDFFSEETAGHFGAACQHCAWCFQPWKDIVIPGFVEQWSVRKMRALQRDPRDRKFTACYHGADSAHLAIYAYANTSVRNRLQDLRDLPNVSIGHRYPMITDYFARLGDCHFCFVPKGLGYWSNRLYEVMFAGCIPILLSDEIGLPFEDFLDWTAFSLKWPMSEVSPGLVFHLERSLTTRWHAVEQLHKSVELNRCWFDYHSENPACSPYLGITRALQKRKTSFPRWQGRSWHRPK